MVPILLAVLALGTGGRKPDPEVGHWKLTAPAGAKPSAWDWTLDIRADGTFRQHRDLRINARVVGDGHGKWRRERVGIRLTGTSVETYVGTTRKMKRTRPIHLMLELRNGNLASMPAESRVKITKPFVLVFRRVTVTKARDRR